MARKTNWKERATEAEARVNQLEKTNAELTAGKVECHECNEWVDRDDAQKCSECNKICCSSCVIGDDICPSCAPHRLESLD